MLRRKTIIVLVITLMVATMVTAFSYLYISQILRLRIANAYESARALPTSSPMPQATTFRTLAARKSIPITRWRCKRALTEFVQTDVNLNNLLQSDPGDWRYIYDVAIVDINGKALLHTNESLVGKIIRAAS